MKKKRFNVEQIVAVLKQAEAGVPLAELIRRVGISEQPFYRWKKQYAGLEVDQVRQLKQLQEEYSRLKQLVADLVLDDVVAAPAEHFIASVTGQPFGSPVPVSNPPLQIETVNTVEEVIEHSLLETVPIGSPTGPGYDFLIDHEFILPFSAKQRLPPLNYIEINFCLRIPPFESQWS